MSTLSEIYQKDGGFVEQIKEAEVVKTSFSYGDESEKEKGRKRTKEETKACLFEK